MGLGARLKELRVRKGESLQDVADAVKASKPHIWELEAEKSTNPSLELLTSLADHFQVPVSYLLEESASADAMIFGREFKGATEDDKRLFWQMAERMKLNRKADG
jgi:transcriptional regulator with XRE-family HTH domain